MANELSYAGQFSGVYGAGPEAFGLDSSAATTIGETAAKPGFLSTLGGIIGGPAGVLGGGILGLVGQGITGWLNYKQQEENREDAEKRYQEEMVESTRRWEAGMEMRREQLGLNKAQFYQTVKNNKEQMKNYYDERNNTRYNQLYSNLMGIVNTSGLRNKYLETWGR